MRNYMSPIVVALLFVAALSFGAGPATAPATQPAVVTVGPEEFQKAMAETKGVVLDVRTPGEFSRGYIAGAVNLNLHAKDFAEQIGKMDKDKVYYVYCASGGRSAMACAKMLQAGFVHLYSLKGGIDGWKKAGKPVEGATP